MGSALLAKERGAYESFKGSKWDRGILPIDTIALLEEERGMKIDVDRTSTLDWDKVRETIKEYGMRNSNTMAVAPTATISNIAGCVPTIEPIYKNIYAKSNQGGDFVVVNTYLIEDLKKLGLWDETMMKKIKYHDGNISQIEEIPVTLRNKYKEVFDIEPEWLIRAAAYRGKWIDQSQSLNIYYAGTSGADIDRIYRYAWEMGLKTTYYLRTLAASQVEKSTVNASEFGSTHIRKRTEAADAVSGTPVEEGAHEEEAVPVASSGPIASNAPAPAKDVE
jgi:ribonucleoside-diphosphate reductase alpha chain